MRGINIWSALHRSMFTNVCGDVLHSVAESALVSEFAKRRGNSVVDDLHCAAAHQLLVGHEAKRRFDAGGIAIHEIADGSGWRKHRDLAVTEAEFGAKQ